MSEIDNILKFDPGKAEEEMPEEVSAILKFDPVQKLPEPQVNEPQLSPSPEDENLTWREAVVEGFQNIPQSGWQFINDVAAPFKPPYPENQINFAKGVKNLAQGAYEKLTPGEQENEKYADAFVDFYKNRYGSVEGFKEAVAKDPVGVLADGATVLSGAGAALKGIGVVSKSSKLAKAGSIVSKAGMEMEPVNVVKEILRQPTKIVPKNFLRKQYQSAVKFGTTVDSKKLKRIVDTALMEEIMPTSRGLVKLVDKIEDYNTEVTKLIADAGDTGKKINIQKLMNGLDDIRKEARRTTDQPLLVDAAFKRTEKNWQAMLQDGEFRTPAEIQKVKTTIYKDLKSLYEQNMSAPIKHKFRKAIAKNAKESLEDIIPEIKDLNKNEGALLELLDEIESKANRIENRDIVSIGLPIKMGAGSGIGYMFGGQTGGKIGSQIGFIMGLYDTPQIKAKIAIVINKLKEKGITVKPTPTLVRLGLYEVAKPDKFLQETDENIAP